MKDREQFLEDLVESSLAETLPSLAEFPGVGDSLRRKRRLRAVSVVTKCAAMLGVVLCCLLWGVYRADDRLDSGLVVENKAVLPEMIVLQPDVLYVTILDSKNCFIASVQSYPMKDILMEEDEFLEVLYALGGGVEEEDGVRRYIWRSNSGIERI